MSESPEKPVQKKEPPYGAEYAKSGRSKCKACHDSILQGSLRMCTRTQSRFFDGLQDNWFHFQCFWKRAKAENLSEANIRNMESLKWDDQEKIRTRIAEVKESAVDAPTPKTRIPHVETAKSGSGKCFECKEIIHKGELRIQLKGSNFHPPCLKDLNVINVAAEEIEGFEYLNDDKKKELVEVFGKPKKRNAKEEVEGTPKKKAKKEIDDELKEQLKKQSDTFWEVKKDIQEKLTREEIDTILQTNSRYRRKRDGPEATADQLADCIIFGVPEKCPDCEGTLFYSNGSHKYLCSGYISDYTRCNYGHRNPERKPIIIPGSVKESNEFLKNHKFPKLPERIYAVTEEEVNSIQEDDPLQKLTKKRKAQVAETKSNKQAFVKNGCTIDADCAVAEIAHVYVDKNKTVYQATLGHTSLSDNKNSYYKIQLLKHDKDAYYYIYRSWGRIGSKSGGNKLEYFDDDLEDALKTFKYLFKDKSGNDWENRDNFQKKPAMLDLLEMELDGKNQPETKKFDIENSKSKLAKPIKYLLEMIFDMEAINDTLKALDLDIEKMPLGKLSANHIKKAYSILSELSNALEKGDTSKNKILDASNRFYTMIPHVTGSAPPPLLNKIELIREKAKMLDDLLEIQLTYSLLKEEEKESETSQKDVYDMHYEKLECQMDVLDTKSEEYKIIQEYATKTHGPTHGDYKLEITDVFKLNKQEEEERFKTDIENVNLLWHGSRTSNYAGILSQGLRIAPPEAPSNGYMFGKGVYFADMVSKSANYCSVRPTDRNNEGLLLLCEVALGEVQEEKRAKEITKLKKNKDSVKGIGEIYPDEKGKKILKDGIIVPIGKPKKMDKHKGDLIYNEYIVYDVSQIKMRYLVKAKFVY